MNFKLELIPVPVSDVDRAKDFYVGVGFNADHDHRVSDEVRFVQLTPPGSACSITIGNGITEMAPGSLQGLQMVVDDADAAPRVPAGARHRGHRGAGLSVGSLHVLRRSRRQQLGGPAASGSLSRRSRM